MNLDRRTYLRTVAAAGTAATAGFAGCAGVLGGGDASGNVVLGPPDLSDEDLTLERYRGHRYPVWGEPIPDLTIPAVPEGEVSLREVSTPALYTYFYSNCRDFCPRLVSTMVKVQDHAVRNGYADEVAFHPITFDPARDDAGTLRDYADRMGVRDAGTWRFLRPPTPERAREVVGLDGLGIGYGRPPADEGKTENYDFQHPGVITLVNPDGYVERAYQLGSEALPFDRMIEDLRTVRTA
jgi:protein SCO1/2